MNKWILVAALALVISVPAFASDKNKTNKSSGNAEQQVSALVDQGREAALKNDTSFIEQHISPDVTYVTGSGMVMTRDQLIESRKSGQMKYDSIDVRDKKVKVTGNTAIANIDATVKGNMNGQSVEGEYRVTQTWVKQGNEWKMVSFQSTPVQNPAAAKK